MKKIIVFLLLCIALASCTLKNEDGSIIITESNGVLNPRIEIIDECEYILWNGELTHKGNCKYCKERHEKELKELKELIKNENGSWPY